MSIGEKIRKVREAKGLKQEAVADELGMTQSAFSKIERGESDITFSRLDDIAKTLGMTASELFNFGESMTFNVMHNETGQGLVIHQMSVELKKAYEDQIIVLKEQNEHLKAAAEDLRRMLERALEK